MRYCQADSSILLSGNANEMAAAINDMLKNFHFSVSNFIFTNDGTF